MTTGQVVFIVVCVMLIVKLGYWLLKLLWLDDDTGDTP